MSKKPANSNPTKEFFSLLKTIEKNTKNQARISSYNPDDITSFMVEICPIKGVYQHAKFIFQIQLMLYPREFPNVICLSDIYHPNIEHGEDYHNVCLNLFDNWNRTFGLIDVIQGLIFLLYQPNLSDPISSFFNSKNTNEEIFRKNVYTSLHGGVVDGIEFLPNPGITEYNEVIKKKVTVDQNVIKSDEKKLKKGSEIVEKAEHCEEIKNESNNADNSEKDIPVTTVMTNNSAAEEVNAEDLDDAVTNDDERIPSEVEEDVGENLPTRDIVSPNAFYSDLICSRYAQPDKLSDSEYGSNDIYHASIVFDLFGFPSSSYVSAESELGDDFDSYYDDSEHDEDEEDDNAEFIREDNYISLPTNSQDPSTIFLSKWIKLRAMNNWSHDCPAPMTSIILTNILNPFQTIIGTFFLCDVQNYCNWRFSDQSVYRIRNDDRMLHYMVWCQNLSRWCLRRQVCEQSGLQLLWYSLFVGLSYKIHSRLANIYNYGSKGKFDCLYIKE